MSLYKVYEVNERQTATGIELKKLVLQGEGKQYPDKGVTMFADHPLFTTIQAGDTIEAELQITDSKNINPTSGLPYKNKVLLKPGQQPKSAASPSKDFSTSNAEVKNLINLEVLPRLDKILAWQDRRDVLDGIEPEKKAEPKNLDPDVINFDESPF